MVNRPKQIGTFAESAVLPFIQAHFPDASRNALAGRADLGDIGHAGKFIFEVKGGQQTRQIGDALLADWQVQTVKEAANAHVPFGVLVVQRHGFGKPRADQWWAYVRMADLLFWVGADGSHSDVWVRVTLAELLDILDWFNLTQKPVVVPETDTPLPI